MKKQIKIYPFNILIVCIYLCVCKCLVIVWQVMGISDQEGRDQSRTFDYISIINCKVISVCSERDVYKYSKLLLELSKI